MRQDNVEVYLDIETTGLSPADCMVTVVGIYICNGEDTKVTQLVGKDITTHSILESLDGVDKIYTYNGSRFDLPFIHNRLDINLAQIFPHHDLMYDCWKNNLYGGLKAVERQLGIERRFKDMNGWEAVKLWWKYVESFDLEALNTLLEYNKEDVVNLKTLKAKLLDIC
ncbi:ribonuclease H-like domain-containing protein [Chloroflexota bacterium]